jgi:hypothetical protein
MLAKERVCDPEVLGVNTVRSRKEKLVSPSISFGVFPKDIKYKSSLVSISQTVPDQTPRKTLTQLLSQPQDYSSPGQRTIRLILPVRQ